MARAQNIALFGGTFDPVHLGHLHLARLAVDALALDQVRFIPCQISPHKTGIPPIPAEDRLEMLRLATDALPWAVVDDCEIRQQGPSFSYQTAAEMRARFPHDRLFWILGGDQWAALPRWREPEKLATHVEFIVIARGDDPLPRPGYRMHRVIGQHPASSTAIRHAISTGETAHPWLPPAVSAWIHQRGLYQNG